MQATEAPPEPTTTEPAQPIRSDKQLFRFSTWIHVGPGAETCDEGEQGTCSDPLHFHAWARLPNQFQHRHIREKALAAKARRARQLRDPESDAHAVMEDELDEIARLGDAGRKQLIDDLIGRDWWRDFLEAARDVKEIENDRNEQVYATIDEDQQRFKELDAKPEDERPKDEYEELERHLAAYNDAVDKRRAELEKPRRDSLEERDLNSLIDMVRDEKITAESTGEFMHVYSAYSWLVGTLVKPQGEQRFQSLEQLEGAAPEVIEALKATFDDLERTETHDAAQSKEETAKN